MTSPLQNQEKFQKCCNSQNNVDIRDAFSGNMANDIKYPSIFLVGNQATAFYSFNFKVLQRFGPYDFQIGAKVGVKF